MAPQIYCTCSTPMTGYYKVDFGTQNLVLAHYGGGIILSTYSARVRIRKGRGSGGGAHKLDKRREGRKI